MKIEAARTSLYNAVKLATPTGIVSPDVETALRNAMAAYEHAVREDVGLKNDERKSDTAQETQAVHADAAHEEKDGEPKIL